MTEEEEEFYDDGISPQIPPRDGKDEEVSTVHSWKFGPLLLFHEIINAKFEPPNSLAYLGLCDSCSLIFYENHSVLLFTYVGVLPLYFSF